MRYPINFSFRRYLPSGPSTLNIIFTIIDITVDELLSEKRLIQLLQKTLDYDRNSEVIFWDRKSVTTKELIDWFETGKYITKDGEIQYSDPPIWGKSEGSANCADYEFFVVRKNEMIYFPDYVHEAKDTFNIAAAEEQRRKFNLLLACTGSIATVKLPLILEALAEYSDLLAVTVVFTPSSMKFMPEAFSRPSVPYKLKAKFSNLILRALTDEDEWIQWQKMGDQVLHIELRKWADLLVIAPLSANSIAKMVNGLVEGLLGGIVRAWDREKEMIVAPAMNTLMWEHPLTKKHMEMLREYYSPVVLGPVAKKLACGDIGTGGMEDWQVIVTEIKKRLPVC